jgi:hypothetical protein
MNSVENVNYNNLINNFIESVGEALINIGDSEESIMEIPIRLNCGHTVDNKLSQFNCYEHPVLDQDGVLVVSKQVDGKRLKFLCPQCNESPKAAQINKLVLKVLQDYSQLKQNGLSIDKVNKFIQATRLAASLIDQDTKLPLLERDCEDVTYKTISYFCKDFEEQLKNIEENKKAKQEIEEKKQEPIEKKEDCVEACYEKIENFVGFNKDCYQVEKDFTLPQIKIFTIFPGRTEFNSKAIAINSSFAKISAYWESNRRTVSLTINGKGSDKQRKFLLTKGFKGIYTIGNPLQIESSDPKSIQC